MIKRQDWEPPFVVSKLGWRYHHMGIPTTVPQEGERYIPHLKIYVCGFDTSPFGVEWMRFEDGCNISEQVRTVPHIAFEVDDLESAIVNLNLIGEINSPGEGIRVAMIEHNGMPVELIEFNRNI